MSNNLSLVIKGIDQFTNPAAKVAAQSDKMQDKLRAAAAELERLGGASKSIDRLRALETRLSSTATKFDVARKETAALGRALAASEAPTRKMQAAFERARMATDKLKASHARGKAEVAKLRAELRAAGVDTRHLADAQQTLGRRTDDVTAKMERQAAAMARHKKLLADRDAMLMRMASFSMAGASVSQFGAMGRQFIGSGVRSIRPIEAARGDLQSLGVGDTSMFDRQIAAARKRFAYIDTAEAMTAAYDLRSGIQAKDMDDAAVARSTAWAAITGRATKSTTGDMAALLPTAFGIFKSKGADARLSPEAFAESFFGQTAGAVQRYRMTGTEFRQIIENTGAGLTNAGISRAEQVAAAGMMKQVYGAEKSGTSMQALSNVMGTAQERARAAGVNLNLLDGKGNMRSLADILDVLRGRYGDTLSAADKGEMLEIFGQQEAVRFFDTLWGRADDLRRETAAAEADAAAGRAKFEEMATRRDDTFDGRMNKAAQSMEDVQKAWGHAVEPFIDSMLPAVTWLGRFTEKLAEDSPTITKVIGGIAFAGVGLASAVGPAITQIGTLYFGAKYLKMTFFDLRRSAAEASIALSAIGGGPGGGAGGAVLGGGGKGGRGIKGALAKGGKAGLAAGASLAAIGGAFALYDIWAGEGSDTASTADKGKATTKEVGGAIGGILGIMGGSAAGMATGAAIGSIVPGVGTVIGGAVGLIASGLLSYLGSTGGEKIGETVGEMLFGEDSDAARQKIAAASGDDGKAMTAANSGSVRNEVTITVVQQPGESGADLANRIGAKFPRSSNALLGSTGSTIY